MTDGNSCVFCKIAKKEIQSDILYEDAELAAFRDVNPKAPVHVLVVPKKHLSDHYALEEKDARWVGNAHLLVNRLAKDLEIEDGFRVVINCGEKAGQTVPHFHIHLMGGRDFHWPPG
ncbi:MAG: histidine triad nucleotide-binding protein [Candidatus Eremiobacteraeota bacterium]|jgi:histidine triad (HIT) family protein|nr:histidine triad nucleotide-binding protein [Candidatus Eremiobacteraeota bacterium]MCL5055574.1 histidine triad nucleotide-binding protein [Bacillota bacterium]